LYILFKVLLHGGFDLQILGNNRNFIFQPNLESQKDTVGIFDLDKNLLARYRHEHTWRSPRGPIRISKKARATDVYLESANGTLFGEINEIPPKLFSSRLIRKFEIYNEKKELVGIVREKPKMIGSDWVLENLDEKIIAVMVGDRKKKNYEINSQRGEVLANCFVDSSLEDDSFRVDIFKSVVDLFLVLSYIIVLDLAKTAWTTRTGGFIGGSNSRDKKEHLEKTRVVEEQKRKTKASQKSPIYAIIIAVMSIIQAILFFSLAGTAFISIILYPLPIGYLVIGLLGVTFLKINEHIQIAFGMGGLAVISLFLGGIMLDGAFGQIPSELTIIVYAIMIGAFVILINLWAVIGLFDGFMKNR